MGMQKWATIIIFVAYYIVALPLAVPLTLLTPLNIKGLWIGFLVALVICALVYLVVINFGFDWDKLEKQVRRFNLSNTTTVKPLL